MSVKGRAYFVYRPESLADLRRPHRPEEERPYAVVKRIYLLRIDYENFITDLYADRQFIEDYGHFCSEGEEYRCLLVTTRGGEDGILVTPLEERFVRSAAYWAV